MIPRCSLNEIPQFQAAKWLKLPLLLSIEEMHSLLKILPQWIVPLSGVIDENNEILTKEEFLALYQHYIQKIDEGIKRPDIDRRLTCAFSNSLDNFRAVSVSGGLLIRIIYPVLQVQPYWIHYSKISGKFIDSTHSQDSFAFGLVFSSPQLFQNPETKDIGKFSDQTFKNLQLWSRKNTRPTPFLVDDCLINFHSRIGKTKKIPICIPQS